MSKVTKENKKIAIKFFEALSSGSESYLDFYNDDSIIWTAGDNHIGGTRTKQEIITFAQGILFFLNYILLYDHELIHPKDLEYLVHFYFFFFFEYLNFN